MPTQNEMKAATFEDFPAKEVEQDKGFSLEQLLGDEAIDMPLKQKQPVIEESPMKIEKVQEPIYTREELEADIKVTLQPEETPELPEKEKEF